MFTLCVSNLRLQIHTKKKQKKISGSFLIFSNLRKKITRWNKTIRHFKAFSNPLFIIFLRVNTNINGVKKSNIKYDTYNKISNNPLPLINNRYIQDCIWICHKNLYRSLPWIYSITVSIERSFFYCYHCPWWYRTFFKTKNQTVPKKVCNGTAPPFKQYWKFLINDAVRDF